MAVVKKIISVQNGPFQIVTYEKTIDTDQPKCRVEGFRYLFNSDTRLVGVYDLKSRVVNNLKH